MAQRKQASFSELRVGILVLSALAILILVIFAVSGDIKLPGIGKDPLPGFRPSWPRAPWPKARGS